MGALAVTLIPFLAWFMGSRWTATSDVLWLVLARFFITGNSSPAGYALIGFGEFKAFATRVERELLAAVILSLLLGFQFGVRGIAISFLAATLFASFIPILQLYALHEGLSTLQLLRAIWWRALLAFAISLGVALLLGRVVGWRAFSVLAGGVGAAVAVATGIALAFLRLWAPSRQRRPFSWYGLLQQM